MHPLIIVNTSTPFITRPWPQTMSKLNCSHFLDIRARAYSLYYQMEEDHNDVEKMIQYVSESATGYIRGGRIFSLYGYPQCAIKVYEAVLQNIKTTSSLIKDEDLNRRVWDIQKLDMCKK
ncbi:hypothetical protein BDA99DRAFT_532756 [Phascolomyces articulosus]|uniref:Uncharacterized protein n=1 Tax=Phascolomyces articulosus TaxID=60185 RepID=A0AAD5KAA7_9FUNG|nr:hypothetical protein BDA99DRAFT_532756 [Phascolomyces articulosus]